MVKKTIEQLLQDGVNTIKKRDYNNPSLDVQLILSYLLKQDKMFLFLHKNDEVDENVSKIYYDMIEKRNGGYPLQYMTNSQEFMGLDFFVQDGVLVPRPDTETLVEKIIDLVNKTDMKTREIKILDIGTGSGAIAVSLAYYLKNSIVHAIDISQVALDTTIKNIKKHDLKNITVANVDIFNFPGDSKDKYDIVVSNPPYIESQVIAQLQIEVSKYEPKTALDGGSDGLEYYRQIAKIFKNIHTDSGVLAVEIGCDQRDKVIEIFENTGLFKKIEFDKDLSGNDRVVTGFL